LDERIKVNVLTTFYQGALPDPGFPSSIFWSIFMAYCELMIDNGGAEVFGSEFPLPKRITLRLQQKTI
jgi:hypothetical protein